MGSFKMVRVREIGWEGFAAGTGDIRNTHRIRETCREGIS
jgi:hypothetical protein